MATFKFIPLGIFSKKHGYKELISQHDVKENMEEQMDIEETENIDNTWDRYNRQIYICRCFLLPPFLPHIYSFACTHTRTHNDIEFYFSTYTFC